MDVHVDQARHHGGAAKVDHLRPGHILEALANLRDLAAANDDGGVAQRGLAGLGDQRPGVDYGDPLGGLSIGGCGERERGTRGAEGKSLHFGESLEIVIVSVAKQSSAATGLVDLRPPLALRNDVYSVFKKRMLSRW